MSSEMGIVLNHGKDNINKDIGSRFIAMEMP